MYEKERKEMVSRLAAFGYLRSEKVIEAMETVERHVFVPDEMKRQAYDDVPLPIGGGQTISAPHMVAIMCDALELSEGQKVLEIGAGSGYNACIVAHVVKKPIITIERVEALAERAKESIAKAGCSNVEIIIGDGTRGYETEMPYDRILVTAGAPDIPPPLIEQLKDGGILLIPVGLRYMQELILVRKVKGELQKKNLGGCAFVPLIGEYGWQM